MMSLGIVNNLSVKLLNEPGYEGKITSEILLEHFAFGEPFSLTNLGRVSINQLYSNNYNDCLWVVIDSDSITFEELCEEFDTIEDMIVSQVIHLEYEKLSDIVYITHLDHEYIFYTKLEYEERKKNYKQKGTAQERIKTFKIDNSRIPFDYQCKLFIKDELNNVSTIKEEQFLCYVLDSYFKHKDLLKEYFCKTRQG